MIYGDVAKRVTAISDSIHPTLDELDSRMHLVVLSDLVAHWVARHLFRTPEETAACREEMLAELIDNVRELAPIHFEMMMKQVKSEGSA